MRGASAAKHEKMNASETLRAEERRRAGVRINACRCGTASRQTPRRTYRRSQEGTGEPKQLLRPTHLLSATQITRFGGAGRREWDARPFGFSSRPYDGSPISVLLIERTISASGARWRVAHAERRQMRKNGK